MSATGFQRRRRELKRQEKIDNIENKQEDEIKEEIKEPKKKVK